MVINNLDTFVIPLASSYRDQTWALAAGWGETLSPQGVPNQLQSLWTEVMNHQECVQRLDPHNVNEAKLCTFRQTGKGICQGDSGQREYVTPSISELFKKIVGVLDR
jgi:hypothetical protein